MNTMIRIFIIAIYTMLNAAVSFSQSVYKMGHIDSDQLVRIMPEHDSAMARLEKAIMNHQRQLEAMQVEFKVKYEDYARNRNTSLETIRRMKEEELQDLNIRIQQFQLAAEENIEATREALFRPVIDKAKKAIADVAKENNFAYVFDLSEGFVIFYDDSAADILPLVKQKLGID